MSFPKGRSAALGLAFLLGCGLAGCADDDTPIGTSFTYNGNTWRVADVREEGRLTISAIDPRLAGLGTEAAARHQVATMPEAEYRAAATGWLTISGRFCTPGPAETPGGDTLDADSDTTGYQYHYSCWVPA
jgi:hypothetical protein